MKCALAIRTRCFAGRLAQTIHAYPTMSLAVQQAPARPLCPCERGANISRARASTRGYVSPSDQTGVAASSALSKRVIDEDKQNPSPVAAIQARGLSRM
jgi:hypothetical protein